MIVDSQHGCRACLNKKLSHAVHGQKLAVLHATCTLLLHAYRNTVSRPGGCHRAMRLVAPGVLSFASTVCPPSSQLQSEFCHGQIPGSHVACVPWLPMAMQCIDSMHALATGLHTACFECALRPGLILYMCVCRDIVCMSQRRVVPSLRCPWRPSTRKHGESPSSAGQYAARQAARHTDQHRSV